MSTTKKARHTRREAIEKVQEIKNPAFMTLDEVADELKLKDKDPHRRRQQVKRIKELEFYDIPGRQRGATMVKRKSFERYFDLIDDKDREKA